MQISVKTANEVKVLAFEGSLDTQTSSDALTQLTQLIEGGDRKILVNFEKLHYISSVGLRILLAAAKQLKTADGELRICDLNEVVKEVFDISGFTLIFKIFGTESEALKEF
jgi:anti-sigma B factor antagonist